MTQNDTLRLFNTKLVAPLVSMSDDQLWDFLLENQERIRFLTDRENSLKIHIATGFFYAFPHGLKHFHDRFLAEIEEDRAGVVFTLVMDFCFHDEKVNLGFYARGGYLDHADSCDTRTSDEIMPPVDEDSEAFYDAEYFHLLTPVHLDHIIRAMEKNIAKLTFNTREDIIKIKAMRQFCRQNEGFDAAYVYNNL
jgi:hypothetical protein